jgi:hypothetical protein
MSASYDDNLPTAVASFMAEVPKEDHTLTHANVAPYAAKVHARKGAYVFNRAHLSKKVYQALAEKIASPKPLNDNPLGEADLALEDALFEAAQNHIDWLQEALGLRSLNPVTRHKHKRGWGDVTRLLINSHRFQVDDGPIRKSPASLPPLSDADEDSLLSFPR